MRRKRRSRPSLARRLRTYWIVSTLAAIVTVVAVVQVIRWPGFRPSHVTVVGADAHVTSEDVQRAAAIDPHGNIWLMDKRAAERRVEALPYAGTVTIHRTPPGSVTIAVAPRTADGCVAFVGAAPDADVTVDARDRVLATGCDDAPSVTYRVAGRPVAPGRTLDVPELATLQSDRQTLDGLGRHFVAFSSDRFGGLDATLPNGIAVEFGNDADLDRKERLIGPVLAAVANRIRAVTAVDLRSPSTPVVDFR